MKSKLALFAAFFGVFLLSNGCFAVGKAESGKIASFWKAPSTIDIPVTTEDGTAQVQFPAIPQKKGMIPVVRFQAFLDTPTPSGWSHYMKISLNDKAAGAETESGKSRLLNRAKDLEIKDGMETAYTGDALLSFFGPDGAEVDSRVKSDRGEGYWYLLNISDLANYLVIGVDNRIEHQEPNKLTITSTYKYLDSGETSACKRFVIKNLEVGYMQESEVNKLVASDAMQMPHASGPSIVSGDGKLIVGKDGAMELKVGNESYFFNGIYSYPGKSAMEYNRMGWDGPSAPGWKITRELNTTKQAIVVTGDWKNYTITRTIKADKGRFRVYDKIANKTSQPMGMRFRYNAITNDQFGKTNVFLCGSGSLSRTDNCGTNPSAFIGQKRSSLGILIEDTLFRLQMDVARRENRIEYGSEHFGLEPNKSYTLEWTIYPSKSTDYWDFVNRVRRDWKVNFTIEGPCPLGDEHVVPGRKALLYPITPWFRYYSGETLTAEQYRDTVKPKIQKLLAEQPDAVPIALIETNLVPYDTRESGGIVPKGSTGDRNEAPGTYGLELTAEQTEFVKKLPWWDSQIKTGDGRGVIDTCYPRAPYCDLMVYPAPGNYQTKYMKWEADYLMDECGMKGIYMDQFNLGLHVEQPGRSDYSKWDGHTVDLKPNGEISRAYTDGTLVGAPARAEIIRHIQSKGGIVITNGHPVARETTGLRVHAFAETEWDVSSGEELLSWGEPPYIPSIAEAQLSSPISLGIRPNRFNEFGKEHLAEIIHKWVITCLKNGTVYYYYVYTIPKEGPGSGEYGIINHMFPFTPVELHAGWLIGKERILTAKSGSFFWNNPKKPIVLDFDLKGRAVQPQAVNMLKKGNGWQVYLKIRDWNEAAVIKDPAEK